MAKAKRKTENQKVEVDLQEAESSPEVSQVPAASSVVLDVESPPPVKRKVGRPRKAELVAAEAPGSSSVIAKEVTADVGGSGDLKAVDTELLDAHDGLVTIDEERPAAPKPKNPMSLAVDQFWFLKRMR